MMMNDDDLWTVVRLNWTSDISWTLYNVTWLSIRQMERKREKNCQIQLVECRLYDRLRQCDQIEHIDSFKFRSLFFIVDCTLWAFLVVVTTQFNKRLFISIFLTFKRRQYCHIREFFVELQNSLNIWSEYCKQRKLIINKTK